MMMTMMITTTRGVLYFSRTGLYYYLVWTTSQSNDKGCVSVGGRLNPAFEILLYHDEIDYAIVLRYAI